MNLKKAKQLRKSLRAMNVDPKEKIFTGSVKKIQTKLGISEFVQCQLTKTCGRKAYQIAKQEGIRHGFSK
jgi:hypothetical protein